MKLEITSSKFNKNPYYLVPLKVEATEEWYKNLPGTLKLFDQNGFDLCVLERYYAKKNLFEIKKHRNNHSVLRQDWFTSEETLTGAHINHAVMFERKGFSGAALEQLKSWAPRCNLLNKLIQMKPKWGLYFSIDYCDAEGNVFELLHWEWDSFDLTEIKEKKKQMDDWIVTVDWDEAAHRMLDQKSEWHHLDFFAQSEWKTRFFGIEKERFKMVLWK